MTDVPIGSIIPFIGREASLPKQWAVCKGQKITDRSSPLNGTVLPDLTDNRFLMGVAPSSKLGEVGGSNSIAPDGGGSVNITTGGTALAGWGHLPGGTGAVPIPDSGHTHSGTAQISPHDHGGDNRPQWCAVLYICRIS